MSEKKSTEKLLVDLSSEEQELVQGGQFFGQGGYTNLDVMGGGYGYPGYGGYGGLAYPGGYRGGFTSPPYGGYGYPGYGGYGYPGRGYFPGVRQFGVVPGNVTGF
ncbi:MAG TPA: hypothetical protein VK184_22560 [Nostocaceae cyanobacterium]|nr:hypothetical protein [Nostocaceae cyanobacterium]